MRSALPNWTTMWSFTASATPTGCILNPGEVMLDAEIIESGNTFFMTLVLPQRLICAAGRTTIMGFINGNQLEGR